MTPRPAKRAHAARGTAGLSRVRAAALSELQARLADPQDPAAVTATPLPCLELDGAYRPTLHGPDAGLTGGERAALRERESRRKAHTVRAYWARKEALLVA